MKNLEIENGCIVQLTGGYHGLEEGSTGIVVNYTSGDYWITINNIKGCYTPYCYYCDEYDCGCTDQEEWNDNHSNIDIFTTEKVFLKVISAPEADTLILLI
jgi:hypothetical protein